MENKQIELLEEIVEKLSTISVLLSDMSRKIDNLPTSEYTYETYTELQDIHRDMAKLIKN